MSRILLLCSSVSQHAVKRFLCWNARVVRVNPSSSNRKHLQNFTDSFWSQYALDFPKWVTATKSHGLGIGMDRGTTLMIQEEGQDEVAAHHVSSRSSGYRLILVQYISILRVGWPWEGFPPPPLLVASLIWIHLLQSPATEIQRIFNFKSTLPCCFWPSCLLDG